MEKAEEEEMRKRGLFVEEGKLEGEGNRRGRKEEEEKQGGAGGNKDGEVERLTKGREIR